MSKYLNLDVYLPITVGDYNIPKLYPTYIDDINVREWIPFNYAKTTSKDKSKLGINFYLHDYQFERVWNMPQRYLDTLLPFSAVMTPDFSLYRDYPKALQIYNHYRKHWLGAYWQANGLTVIPTICWSDRESFNWCFDGEPEGSVVSVSNVGCVKDKEKRQMFKDGYREMIIRLQPSKIIFYAHTFDIDDFSGNIEFVRYTQSKKEEKEDVFSNMDETKGGFKEND